MAVMVEVAVDRDVGGAEFLEGLYVPEARRWALSDQMRLRRSGSGGTGLVRCSLRRSENDAFVRAADSDPCDPVVLRCIQMIIEGAIRNGCPVGICGPAPSEHRELASSWSVTGSIVSVCA